MSDAETVNDAEAVNPSGSEVSIDLRDIVQEYPQRDGTGVVRIIDRVSILCVRPSIVMLLGPSGCGKSTLLHMMGGVRPIGVQTPTAGEVRIDGERCDEAHPDEIGRASCRERV